MDFELSLDPIGKSEILSLEKHLGVSFPDDYRTFLLQYNGGRPALYVMDGPFGKLGVNNLYGIGKIKGRVYDIAECFEDLDYRLPKGFIPIGDNAGGDQLLIATDGAGVSGVFLFDHENEPADANIPWENFPNLYKLSDSFNEFLGSLQSDE